jgi:hypothetical protein
MLSRRQVMPLRPGWGRELDKIHDERRHFQEERMNSRNKVDPCTFVGVTKLFRLE